MSALTVTLTLDQPVVGLLGNPFPLDGPLSWLVAQTADLPAITPQYAPDVDLPLEKWEEAGTWGWKCSRALYEVTRWVSVDIRRRPAAAAMARYTSVPKHHLGLGPHKARNVTSQAAWVRDLSWHVIATDDDVLRDLVFRISHVGKHTNIGYGHVQSWSVLPCVDEGAWRDRPMPTPGQSVAVRPPYWHATRRVSC